MSVDSVNGIKKIYSVWKKNHQIAFQHAIETYTLIRLNYTFTHRLKEYDPAEFEYKECDTGKTVKQTPCCNFNSAAQFYVFVGVMAFLYCIASLILYVFFDEKWRNMDLIPIAVSRIGSHIRNKIGNQENNKEKRSKFVNSICKD